MMRIRVARQAREDLRELGNYLDARNPAAARRVLIAIQSTIQMIAEHRLDGQSLERLRPGLRAFPARSPANQYVIFYRLTEQVLEVVTVIHGRRDWASLFERGERSPGKEIATGLLYPANARSITLSTFRLSDHERSVIRLPHARR